MWLFTRHSFMASCFLQVLLLWRKKITSLELRVQVPTSVCDFAQSLSYIYVDDSWDIHERPSSSEISAHANEKENKKKEETALDRLCSLCVGLYSLCQGNCALTITLKILLNLARARNLFPDLFLTIFILVPRATCSSGFVDKFDGLDSRTTSWLPSRNYHWLISNWNRSIKEPTLTFKNFKMAYGENFQLIPPQLPARILLVLNSFC